LVITLDRPGSIPSVQNARATFLKTYRVQRLALVWAQEAALVEKAPVPEDAATY
jgi:hypothetical protein